jgi:AraC-like DNA-binding protein
MKISLHAHDLPELAHTQEFAANFRTQSPVQEQRYQFRLGEMEVQYRQAWFDGVLIGWGDFQLPKPLVIQAAADAPTLEMHFSLSMDSTAVERGSQREIAFGANEHNVLYAPAFVGELCMAAGKQRQFLEINLGPAFWDRFQQMDSPALERLLRATETQRVATLGPQNRPISPAMHRVIQDISQAPYAGTLQRLFLEAKVLELIVLQQQQFEENAPAKLRSVNRRDAEKLHALRTHLMADPNTSLSLGELARLVELNEFKVKQGFRELFGTSVFGFLRELRLERAYGLLRENRLSIAEVSDRAGYKNPTHFTAAFRKKFGCVPRQVSS